MLPKLLNLGSQEYFKTYEKYLYFFQAIARQYFAQAYLLEQKSMFKAKSIVPFSELLSVNSCPSYYT